MLNQIPNHFLYQPQMHVAFHTLLQEKFIDKKSSQIEGLPMEVKYVFIQLSSLGVVNFTDGRIELADGMESWMQGFWREISVSR